MIQVETLFAQFERSLLTSGLQEPLRSRLRLLAQPHNLPRSASIDLSSKGGSIVFVGSGALKLLAHAVHDREQVVAFYFAGDFLTLPTDGQHNYSLKALSRSSLLVFPYARFLTQVHGNPDLLESLLDRHAQSLLKSREKAFALYRKTASERLASFLIAMAGRIGRPGGTGIEIELPMSRQDIANSLGLTIETVSRQFSKMREDGLLETHGRSGVALPSLAAMEECSGSFHCLI